MSDDTKMTMERAQEILRQHGFHDYPTGWIEKTAELLEREPSDDYGIDFEAWESFMLQRTDSPCLCVSKAAAPCNCSACEMSEGWRSFNVLSRVRLYSIMTDMCRVIAESNGWKPTDPPDPQAKEVPMKGDA